MLSLSWDRFVVPPANSEDPLRALYNQAVRCFWTPAEVDLAKDREQFDQLLTPDERRFIANVLAFFAASDGIVNENLALRFYTDTENPVARLFYGFQMAMEGIHAETYTLMIDTFLTDSAERERAFHAVERIPGIKRKAEWAVRWIEDRKRSFAERLGKGKHGCSPRAAKLTHPTVAFAAVEGIFFSSSFCAIFWLKKRGLMPGLCMSNELISRDEGLHCRFACELLAQMGPPGTAHAIISEAVRVEHEFVHDTALSAALIGMNAELMCRYVEACADKLLDMMGLARLFGTQNPFPWMEMISVENKTNFFERRVSEYARADGERTFRLDEEF